MIIMMKRIMTIMVIIRMIIIIVIMIIAVIIIIASWPDAADQHAEDLEFGGFDSSRFLLASCGFPLDDRFPRVPLTCPTQDS